MSRRIPAAPRRALILGAILALLSRSGVAEQGPAPAVVGADRLVVCADPGNLPFSDDRREGFENRIAALLAEELHRPLDYAWSLQRRGFLRRTLQAGRCDVVLDVPAGLPGLALTRPYARSTYVFVTATGRAPITSFDDPALRTARVGLPALGMEGANTPAALALARRGLVGNLIGFPVWGPDDVNDPQARLIEAVARGEIDVAIVWGPIGYYFAGRQSPPLVVTPIPSDARNGDLTFTFELSAGVRRGDEALRRAIDEALARRRDGIAAILRDFNMPGTSL